MPGLKKQMTDKEYKQIIKRLNEINQEQFHTILDLNKRIRELEELQKVKRVQKL